jgi:hypothetical protein
MATAFSTTLRTARATAIVTAAGASAKLKFYNGTRPASGAAAPGTLLATLNMGSVIGTVSGAIVTIDTVSITQSNGSHVTGTPTWVRLTTSADVFVADFSIPGDFTFTGTVATGVNVVLGASSFTEGNP